MNIYFKKINEYILKNIFYFLLWAFVALGLIIRTIKLGNFPLSDWDDAVYARIGEEMVVNRSLEASYLGIPWLEKPPFFIYPYALIYLIFGQSYILLRLFSTFLTILLITILNLRIVKDTCNLSMQKSQVASILGLSSLIFSSQFVDKSSSVNADIFLSLGWLGYFTFEGNIGKSMCVFLGFGGKSLLGFYPVLIDLTSTLFFRLRFLTKLFKQIVLVIMLPLLWYLWGWMKYRDLFIREHFFDHLMARIFLPIELHFGGRLYYVKALWWDYGEKFFLPILIILAMVCFNLLRKMYLKKNISHIESVRYFLVIFVYFCFLTFTKAKLHWYLFPTLPFIALIMAQSVHFFNKKILLTFTFMILIFALIRFVPQTYFYSNQLAPLDTSILGICISKKINSNNRVHFLVLPQERKNAHVLEAANLQVSTSFRYGGATGFVYSSKLKNIEFIYDTSKFNKELPKMRYLIIDISDIKLIKNDYQFEILCQSGSVLAIKLKG